MQASASRPANRDETSAAPVGRGRSPRPLPASAYGAVAAAGSRRRVRRTTPAERAPGGANACWVLNSIARAPGSFRGLERVWSLVQVQNTVGFVSRHGETAPGDPVRPGPELTRPC